jgi:antitoxin (DNA-binding transcriptional repressor) of toxin-antitoxin stability system
LKSASVTEFKRNPSKYLRFTAAGLRVLILERKKPIAILEPTKPEDDEAAFLKRLIAKGLARGSRKRKPR